MAIQNWSSVTSSAISDWWTRVINYLPSLIGALIVIIIGVIVANVIKWAVVWILQASGLQKTYEQLGFVQSLKNAGIKSDLAIVCGEFLKWVVIILFLIPTATLIGMPQVSNLLNQLVLYLPNIGSAIIIVFLGALFGQFIENVVRATGSGLGTHMAGALGSASRYLIYVFVVLAAFEQLGVATSVISIILIGLISAAALAFGLAFGLGGKDAATDFIAKVRRDFSNK